MDSNPNGTKMYTPDHQITKFKEKSENILVFARVRPVNGFEKAKNALGVVDCPGSREVVVRDRTNLSAVSKTFTFDRVFGPNAKQIDVYKAVVSPLLEEVLLGYNCTVFAYGQTGTGKTFTMEGERSTVATGEKPLTWESDPLAGIVPRAMSQLFDELRVTNSEFTVRVSLVEMYNEEVFDLLSPTEESKPKTVRLYEDSSRKGSVHIQGLEEVIVHNKHEVYAIMERGSQMRKTASTLLNATSSRSHTVFTVTVHIKETSLLGEDLLKIGKLHLVDLAGSENIGRSGAVDKRAREAGNINQSLLTLGRVITALVERGPHIPYRESKLTRLLQDSLGGKTKTSIIATVSPASINLEETLSTLDYAHRAKNIQNRPEVNQKLTKKAMLKEYTEEIERLRRDVHAAREKNGFFVDKENYEHLMRQVQSQGQDLSDKIQHTKNLEEQVVQKETENNELKAFLATANAVNDDLRTDVSILKAKSAELENQKDEVEHLVKVHTETETKLTSEATTLLNTAVESTVSLDSLYSRLERKQNVEINNREAGNRFRSDFDVQLKKLANDIKNLSEEHTTFSGNQRLQFQDFFLLKESKCKEMEDIVTAFGTKMKSMQAEMTRIFMEQKLSNKDLLEKLDGNLKEKSLSSRKQAGYFLESTWDAQILGLLKCFKGAGEEVEEMFLLFNNYTNEQMSMLEMSSKDRLESFAQQMDTVKELANCMKCQHDSFKSTSKGYRDVNEELLTTVRSETKAAIEKLQSALAKSDALEKNLTMEQHWLSDYYDNQNRVVDTNTEQLLEKLKDDSVKTEAFSTKFNCYVDEKLKEMFERKTEYLVFDVDHKKQVKKIDENVQAIVILENRLLEDAQKQTTELLEQSEDTVCKYTEKLMGISGKLNLLHDGHQTEMKQQISDSLVLDHKHVETGRSNCFTNCDFVSESTENFHQRVHMQSGMLNEFWDSTYLIDLPTGATPQRKAYDFPRNLSATSPHERIMLRYRNLKMPKLDDSDIEIGSQSSSTSSGPDQTRPSDESGPSSPDTLENVENQEPNAKRITSNDAEKLSDRSGMGSQNAKKKAKGVVQPNTESAILKPQNKGAISKKHTGSNLDQGNPMDKKGRNRKLKNLLNPTLPTN